VVKTDKEVKRLKEEIEAKKWRMVADQIKSLKASLVLSMQSQIGTDSLIARCQFLAECLS
jgi:hypothetical protein